MDNHLNESDFDKLEEIMKSEIQMKDSKNQNNEKSFEKSSSILFVEEL